MNCKKNKKNIKTLKLHLHNKYMKKTYKKKLIY